MSFWKKETKSFEDNANIMSEQFECEPEEFDPKKLENAWVDNTKKVIHYAVAGLCVVKSPGLTNQLFQFQLALTKLVASHVVQAAANATKLKEFDSKLYKQVAETALGYQAESSIFH